MLVDELKQQVLDGRWLDEQQAKSLLTADREALYTAAHEITRHYLGNSLIRVPLLMLGAAIAERIANGVPSLRIIRQK